MSYNINNNLTPAKQIKRCLVSEISIIEKPFQSIFPCKLKNRNLLPKDDETHEMFKMGKYGPLITTHKTERKIKTAKSEKNFNNSNNINEDKLNHLSSNIFKQKSNFLNYNYNVKDNNHDKNLNLSKKIFVESNRKPIKKTLK